MILLFDGDNKFIDERLKSNNLSKLKKCGLFI